MAQCRAAQRTATATIRAISADLRQALPGVAFGAELTDGMRLERDYPALHPEDVPADLAYCAIDSVDQPVGKLLARSLLMPEADFLRQVASIVGARAQVTCSATGGLAEIGPTGVTRASTLVEWCSSSGISGNEVWAFGDMPNDLPMLAWAGTSFAVANAHPDVRAAASHSRRTTTMEWPAWSNHCSPGWTGSADISRAAPDPRPLAPGRRQ